jgi:hypothetical protein
VRAAFATAIATEPIETERNMMGRSGGEFGGSSNKMGINGTD